MHISSVYGRKATSASAAMLLVAGLLAVWTLTATKALADVSPIASRPAGTVTADALPTAQIDGIVWSTAISGNTVYAGGKFANARPAGVAVGGAGSVARGNLMAYNLTTGAIISSFAPSLNAEVRAVAVSPDGSRLYVGGIFTAADGGVARYRLAAYNTATGALVSNFAPVLSTQVSTIVATNTTVYVGGQFTTAGGQTRNRLAAFNASDGSLTMWNPNADFNVTAMVMAPDKTKLIVGGSFANMGGAPAYGLAAVDANTGALLPWAAGATVQDAGKNAGITNLTTDGTSIFGSGYVFGAGGNLEGSFSADATTGNINWIEDCHGDTYGVYANASAVYTISHAHYCGNIGGYPQTSPSWTFHHALAFTKAATGTIGHDPYGYTDWYGNPSPSLMNWFPDFTTGTVSGQSQAAWTIAGNDSYVVMGGEFPSVNGVAQQGLVRFAVKSIAPNLQAPMVKGGAFLPTLTATAPGTVRVSWQSNWDRDDKSLTYKVVRNSAVNAPVYTVTSDSEFWNRPTIGFYDTGLTPGSTVTYRLFVTDGSGNTVSGDTKSYVVPTVAPTSAFANDVKAAGASSYWRFGETSGTTATDAVAFNDLTESGGITDGSAGAIAGDSNTASTFDGSTGLAATVSPIAGPNTFTESAWIKTTTTSGGKIIGFGDQNTGLSNNYDRHVYMDAAGHLNFGVYNNGSYIITTPKTYNDGVYHQIVASLSSAGMALYVDGHLIGTNGGTTTGQSYNGYWRVGGDSSWSGSNYFAGTIDEVAIYPTALTTAQVRQQYVDSGRTYVGITAPADSYGKAVYNDAPSFFYRMDDASGPTAVDLSGNSADGTYVGGETYGVSSPVAATGSTAVTFDGQEGSEAYSPGTYNPTTYSEELWFNTTTTNGGKLIGFGSNTTGRSGSYDRHVYMDTDGRLNFGTYNGNTNLATSANNGYNDGKWHYLVATQGADGMKLYVDNQLVGTNSHTDQQSYYGYWRIGGDTAWNGTAYFNGTIDEAAVYNTTALTAAQIAAHYNASPFAVHPTAAFTSTASALTANLDASTSTDAGGTIASYNWNFGDGATATGVTTSHTYALSGTYPVALTVTDANGVSNTVTQNVTVQGANVPPTAAFTSSSNGATGSFDGTGSSDPDGSIAGYSWDFGDGSAAGAGATPSHVYTASGTYHVTLTVTDNRGASTPVTHDITITVPNVPPTAAFTSTVNNLAVTFDGSGSADSDGTIASYSWDFGDGTSGTGVNPSHTYGTDGSYTVVLTVTDNSGASTSISHVVSGAANKAPTASFTSTGTNLAVTFDGTASADSDGTVASYSWDFGDGTSGTGVKPSHTYTADGSYTVVLTVTDNQGATGSVSHTVTVAANKAPTAAFTTSVSNLAVNFNATGSADSDGTVASYSWNFGDGTTGTGVNPSHTYTANGSYSVSLTVTDNQGATGTVSHGVTVLGNVAPTATFSYAPTNLAVSFDGTGSSDFDGTVAGYAWNFGDSSTGTGVKPTHTYAAAGTYPVTLTVTDNQGATGSTTTSVTVTSPASNVIASDAFGRTSTSGWGTADVGGAWTNSGSAALYTVAGGVGKVSMAGAGSGPTLYLTAPQPTNFNAVVDTSVDKAPTGGGTYVNLIARHVGTSDYRLKLHFVAGGTVQLITSKVISGTETTLKTVNVPGVTFTVGDTFRLRFVITGSAGTTTLSGTTWKVGTTEPATAQLTGTDATAALQGAGSFGIQSYLSGTSTNAPGVATYDNLSVIATP